MHTPGPWFAQKHQRASLAEQSIDIEAENGRTVASLPDYPNDEDAANARLIAAAPDLLAACQAAREEFESYAFGDASRSINVGHIRDMLRAAIQKATP